jgi:hypothetical protein
MHDLLTQNSRSALVNDPYAIDPSYIGEEIG